MTREERELLILVAEMTSCLFVIAQDSLCFQEGIPKEQAQRTYNERVNDIMERLSHLSTVLLSTEETEALPELPLSSQ
jgi:hypothetical protein